MRLPYLIKIGNTQNNPVLNDLFTTVDVGSGWYTSSSSALTKSGTNLYVSRNTINPVNFLEI